MGQKLDKTGVRASILLITEKATEMKALDKKYEVSNTGNMPSGGFWSIHLYDTGADEALLIPKTPGQSQQKLRVYQPHLCREIVKGTLVI